MSGWPEILEIHRITGDACSMLKVAAGSIGEFEGVIDRLAPYGQPSSTMVLSTPLAVASGDPAARRPARPRPRRPPLTRGFAPGQRECSLALPVGRIPVRRRREGGIMRGHCVTSPPLSAVLSVLGLVGVFVL